MATTTTIPAPDLPITDVAVYLNGARVTRRVLFRPSVIGEQLLVLSGITEAADSSSLRLSGTGPCQIVSVNDERVKVERAALHPTEGTRKEIEGLLALLRKCETAEQELKSQQCQYTGRKAAIETYARSQLQSKHANGFQDEVLALAENMLPLVDWQAEETLKVEESESKLLEEFEVLRIQIQTIHDRLSRLLDLHIPLDPVLRTNVVNWENAVRDYLCVTTTVVKVELEVLRVEEMSFELTYEVRNCHWHPSYNVRVALNPAIICLEYYGHITQKSNEDWTDVKVVLSPLPLENTHSVPKLPSEVAKFPDELQSSANRQPVQPPSGFGGRVMAYKKAVTRAIGSGISAAYEVEKKASVASDGREHKVLVADIRLPCEIIRYAVPSQSPLVYLQAGAKNDSDYHLLESSRVSLFFGSSFVGQTHFRTCIAPGGHFFFCGGVDQSVQLKHIPVRSFEKKEAGIFNVSRTRVYQASTYISTSESEQAIPIVLVSQFPTSSDANITVDLKEPSLSGLIKHDSDLDAALDALRQSSDSGVSKADYLNEATNHIIHVRMLPADTQDHVRTTYHITWPVAKIKEIEI